MLKYIKQSDMPLLLLIVYSLKSMIIGSYVSDSLIIAALSALVGFKLYLDHIKKPDYNQQLRDELVSIQNEIYKKIDILESKVSHVNVALSRSPKKSENIDAIKWGR